jgi:hypothetical protein
VQTSVVSRMRGTASRTQAHGLASASHQYGAGKKRAGIAQRQLLAWWATCTAGSLAARVVSTLAFAWTTTKAPCPTPGRTGSICCVTGDAPNRVCAQTRTENPAPRSISSTSEVP